MESNNQHYPVPANLNRASNSQGTPPEDVSNTDDYIGPNNQQMISYHKSIPDGEYVGVMLSPGYHFCPEDDELIVDYLNKEINKERPEYILFLNVDVYKHSPEELARMHPSLGKDEWFFFSPRERKYLNGNRPNRAAGNGYWKATGGDKKIYSDGVIVGSKKCLVFYDGKPPKGDKTDWIMHEYVSDQPPRQRTSANDMRLDDCVLCRIYKKSEATPKRVETDQQEGSNDQQINDHQESIPDFETFCDMSFYFTPPSIDCLNPDVPFGNSDQPPDGHGHTNEE